jgi:ABC-type Zn2+ transport system substrate-binding protein/surface adhesin
VDCRAATIIKERRLSPLKGGLQATTVGEEKQEKKKKKKKEEKEEGGRECSAIGGEKREKLSFSHSHFHQRLEVHLWSNPNEMLVCCS